LPVLALVMALVTLGGLLVLTRSSRAAAVIRRYLPWAVLAVVLLLASYAYFIRVPTGTLSPPDADAFRTFAQFYLSPLGLVAAMLGLVVVVKRAFWSGLAFVATLIAFSCVFFYKMRVIPEHFWAARRFLAVVLPGACLLIGAAAFPLSSVRLLPSIDRRGVRATLFALGLTVVGFFGYGYYQATLPILNHVEYAGLIPRLEALNSQFRDTDLILVESRQISDMHTLALPLAYIYARNVLVFWAREPDKDKFREFLTWAKGRYQRVLFVGGSGSRLPSLSMTAVPLSLDWYEVPEYESAYHAYPQEVRMKAFEFGVYELLPNVSRTTDFELDVGALDDLYVRQFYAKETETEGRDVTLRWSTDGSSVVLPVGTQSRAVTLWMNDGGRPPQAGRADVAVYLNDTYLGTATPANLFEPYRFDIPPDLASEIGAGEDAALLRLEGPTWSPSTVLGGDDMRELGVMIDRITVG